MNITSLKYAIEIEKTGSISKAAQNLFMGQPNLSRSIKELEDSVGIEIFKRTSKGIEVTPAGANFLSYAKKIISELDTLENMYKEGTTKKQRFSISVPRASYFGDAFCDFVSTIDQTKPMELIYRETNSMRAINNVLQAGYKLGIIRYRLDLETFYQNALKEKGLEAKVLFEFKYHLIMSKKHPLADKESINFADLNDYIEIAHGDPYVPSLPFVEARKFDLSSNIEKHIYIFERASQFKLLEKNPHTFMWISSIDKASLDTHELTERICEDNNKIYKDVLIYPNGYQFSELEERFIQKLIETKNR